jgi:hypothetical protein
MLEFPFRAVARAIRVLMMRALDWEANIASIAVQAWAAVELDEICGRISREDVGRSRFRTC